VIFGFVATAKGRIFIQIADAINSNKLSALNSNSAEGIVVLKI
jgi:hypothetical protein